ncbi:tetratricopeptide repeat protein [Subtercola boreus]|nr:tetratricopeptide repeat protein [Subtercola boreus]
MTEALPTLESEDRLYAVGVVGCWRWHFFTDEGAETQLREGMRYYDSAWASLGHLLVATDRADQGHRTFVDGVAAGNLMCMLPLANRLAEQGDRDAAEQLYRRAFQLGDAYSAWNLSLLFEREGREEEAASWLWKAAQAGDEDAVRALAEDSEVDDTDGVG